MPKSKLSRRIASLEDRLGVHLIQRSTRRFSVTGIGQNYCQHYKTMLIEAEAAQQVIDLTRSEPRGIIRMICPVALLHARVGAMVAAFMLDNPMVAVQLEVTNCHIDVIDEGVDVAIRVRVPPIEDSQLIMKVHAQRSWCLVAIPTLLGLPRLDLDSQQGDHVWQIEGPAGAVAALRHNPRLIRRSAPSYPARAPLSGVDCNARLSRIVAVGAGSRLDTRRKSPLKSRDGFESTRPEPALGLLTHGVPERQIMRQRAPWRVALRRQRKPLKTPRNECSRCIHWQQCQIRRDEFPRFIFHVARGGLSGIHASHRLPW